MKFYKIVKISSLIVNDHSKILNVTTISNYISLNRNINYPLYSSLVQSHTYEKRPRQARR